MLLKKFSIIWADERECMFNFLQKKPLFIIHLNEEAGVPPIPVYEKKIIIGRSGNHVLAIPDNSISRNHIEVNYRGGSLFITDLGTSNGTKVEGVVIDPNVPILYNEPQIIVLGQSEVKIYFEIFKKEKT